MDFLPPPSRPVTRPPQPLDYRSPPRRFDVKTRELGLGSFTLRLLGIIAMIVGLLMLLMLLAIAMFGGIDDRDALEWLVTRGITITGVGIALLVLSVIVPRLSERRR